MEDDENDETQSCCSTNRWWFCGVCESSMAKKTASIACKDCRNWVHLSCANLTFPQAKKLKHKFRCSCCVSKDKVEDDEPAVVTVTDMRDSSADDEESEIADSEVHLTVDDVIVDVEADEADDDKTEQVDEEQKSTVPDAVGDWYCGVCESSMAKKTASIACKDCRNWVHLSCANLTFPQAKKLKHKFRCSCCVSKDKVEDDEPAVVTVTDMRDSSADDEESEIADSEVHLTVDDVIVDVEADEADDDKTEHVDEEQKSTVPDLFDGEEVYLMDTTKSSFKARYEYTPPGSTVHGRVITNTEVRCLVTKNLQKAIEFDGFDHDMHCVGAAIIWHLKDVQKVKKKEVEKVGTEGLAPRVVDAGSQRKRKSEEWVVNVKKRKVNTGEEFSQIRKGREIKVKGKVCKEPCKQQTCRKKCTENLMNDTREAIFQSYWALGDRYAQWDFI